MLMVPNKRNIEAAFNASIDGQNLQPAAGMVMIIVRPGMEQDARDSLRRRGIGAWWPNYKREVLTKDRETGKRYSRLVLTGVLPGILLTPSRLNEHFWAAIDLAPGAINIVRKLNGEAVEIGDTDVVLLHKIEAELNKPLPAEVLHKFEVGNEVVVVGDLMRHFVGKITKIEKSGRIHIDISLFGRVTPMTVLPHQIALI